MRRFQFFDRETVRSQALSCLDITCATAGRGFLAVGDSEGHIVLVDRSFGCSGFQAHKTRVNAAYLLKSCDVLVTVGDGADCRPGSVRQAARTTVMAAREKLRRDRDKDRAAAAKKARVGSGADEGDNEDADAEAEGGEEGAELEQDTDLGFQVGLNFPLEGAASSLVNGDKIWDAGAALGSASDGSSGSGAASGGAGGGSRGEGGYQATLKVWRLDRRDPRTNAPDCIRSVRIFDKSTGAASGSGGGGGGGSGGSADRERLVTALAVSEDCSQVAIGCGDGCILLLRGDLLRGGAREGRLGIGLSLALGSGLRTQVLQEGEAVPATAYVPGLGPNAVTCLSYTAHADPNAHGLDDKAGGGRSASVGRRPRQMLCLFACTPNYVRCYFPTEVRPVGMGRGWGPGEAYIELDDVGAGPGCAALTHTGEWVVGNDRGVFFYSYEDRTAAYVFPGRKQRVGWFRGYLLLVTEEASGAGGRAGPASAPALSRGGGGGLGGYGSASTATPTTLCVYDLRNKFIAYTMTLAPQALSTGNASSRGAGGSQLSQPTSLAAAFATAVQMASQQVRYILSEWGSVFVMVSSADGTAGLVGAGTVGSTPSPIFPTITGIGQPLSAYQLSEKDTGTKVEHLCRLHLFDIAAAVATGARYGSDALADIYKQHGDHLYSRGDFEGAVLQYARTIGHVEPSYVIRRFLDSTRIGNLTSYLEALHEDGHAAAEHTTLLLNCYTKTRQQEKLRRFIRGEQEGAGASKAAASSSSSSSASGGAGGSGSGSSAHSVKFDVRTAIAVLRDADCIKDALWLAETHAEHDAYLAIQCEEATGQAALAKGALPASAASAASASSSGPASTAAASAAAPAAPPPAPGQTVAAATAAVAYIRRLPFVDAEFYCRKFGRALLQTCPQPTTDLLCDLCCKWVQAKPPLPGTGGIAAAAASSSATASSGRERTRADSPDPLLPLFVDSPQYLKRFCEHIVRQASVGAIPKPSQELWHSLLEVSLRKDVYSTAEDGTHVPVPDAAIDAARDEAVLSGILRNLSASFDPAHALLLCQLHGYKAGILYLYERLAMYPLVIAHYMEAAEAARAAGRHAEAKAARRELVRRVKMFTDPSGGNPAANVGRAWSAPEAAALWITTLRYLSRAYLNDDGACVVPSPDAVSDALSASTSSAVTGAVVVTYPGLSAGSSMLQREREEQDSLLSDVLKHIDRTGILPPLTVLQVLAECPHLPFGLVRNFIVRRLGADADRAAEDRKGVASLREDTRAFAAEIERLDSQARVFQSRKCALCNLELDLPSVHFMCGGGAGGAGSGSGAPAAEHCFHQHCVTDAMAASLGSGSEAYELECPICTPTQAKVMEIRGSLGVKPHLQEQFFRELAAAPDGFAKAVEYLAKGIF